MRGVEVLDTHIANEVIWVGVFFPGGLSQISSSFLGV